NEFLTERQTIYDLVPTLVQGIIRLRAWVFEKDTVASEVPSRDIWLEKLESSVLYIGLFGEQYGEWTIDEWEKAKSIGLSRLIFIKNTTQREIRLSDFIGQITNVNTGLTPQYFNTTQDLKSEVANAIKNWIAQRLSNKSRYKLLETLKKCNTDYLEWFDRNE